MNAMAQRFGCARWQHPPQRQLLGRPAPAIDSLAMSPHASAMRRRAIRSTRARRHPAMRRAGIRRRTPDSCAASELWLRLRHGVCLPCVSWCSSLAEIIRVLDFVFAQGFGKVEQVRATQYVRRGRSVIVEERLFRAAPFALDPPFRACGGLKPAFLKFASARP